MYLFNDNLILSKYNNATDILLDFYDIRLEYYHLRKEYLVKRLTNDLILLNSKVRFINEYINGTLDINRKSKDYIVSLLERNNYPKLQNETTTSETETDTEIESKKSYDYLIRMQLVSLSSEKIAELEKQRNDKQMELEILKSQTEKDLWRLDIQEIQKQL